MEIPTLVAVQTQTPSYWGYVLAGYGFAVAAIGSYVVRTVRRGRRLSRRVPAEKRRWL